MSPPNDRGHPGFRPLDRHRRVVGLTLVELLVALMVIGVLASMIIGATAGVRERVEKVNCIGNLRGLHVALSCHVQDKGSWPQPPVDLKGEKRDYWWIGELERFGMPAPAWRCPTLSRAVEESAATDEERAIPIHYIPTEFDASPFTPYRWKTQPWAAEIGDPHGGGALLVFPDGSVKGFNQVFQELTGQAWPSTK
jgi:prepilin-type N-terminal cleavage/methylation domain-containing protein